MSLDIKFLFRFRDLVAKTIEEHQLIIKSSKFCWWGWWKRPTENNYLEVWQEIKTSASLDNPVIVGLFDSGTGKVYKASIIDVTLPKSGPNDQIDPIEVKETEKALIPSYYKFSSYCYAWMKINNIEVLDDFFGNYSYTTLPNLDNIESSVLEKFKDKIIKSFQELRGIDTTIWKIRKKLSTDRDEEIILTTRSVSKPISTEAVELQSDSILHITDLHFALGKSRKQHVWRLSKEDGTALSLEKAIYNALSKKNIGLILVTGDLTFIGSEDEFNEALIFLRTLLNKFRLDPTRLVVIPGNHDITWSKKEKYLDDAKVTEAPEKAKKNYAKFYNQIYGHEPNLDLSIGRRYLLPCGIALEICAINSSSLETGKNFLAGIGRINESAFDEIANKMNWSNLESTTFRLLMIHHHLITTENLERDFDYYRGFGMAIDATKIMRLAAQYGVHLVVHGHKHRVFVWRSGAYHLPEDTHPKWKLGNLSLLGGGSAGSKETEGNKNYFNLINIQSKGIEIEVYRSEKKGPFSSMKTLFAAFELSKTENRLLLNDWQETEKNKEKNKT